MQYLLKIKNDTITADVEVLSQGRLNAVLGDKHYQVTYTRLAKNKIHMNINGAAVTAFVQGSSAAKSVIIRGMPIRVEDAAVLELKSNCKSGFKQTDKEITPPMPAVIIQILVKQEDVVQKGQALVVISAMKMETTLTAPYAGSVTAVNVSVGDKAMPGQRLIEIKGLERN